MKKQTQINNIHNSLEKLSQELQQSNDPPAQKQIKLEQFNEDYQTFKNQKNQLLDVLASQLFDHQMRQKQSSNQKEKGKQQKINIKQHSRLNNAIEEEKDQQDGKKFDDKQNYENKSVQIKILEQLSQKQNSNQQKPFRKTKQIVKQQTIQKKQKKQIETLQTNVSTSHFIKSQSQTTIKKENKKNIKEEKKKNIKKEKKKIIKKGKKKYIKKEKKPKKFRQCSRQTERGKQISTKNLLKFAAPHHIRQIRNTRGKMLWALVMGVYVQQILSLLPYLQKTTLSLDQYTYIYSNKFLKQTWTVYFRKRTLYREYMQSKVSKRNRFNYFRFLNRFENAFKQESFISIKHMFPH